MSGWNENMLYLYNTKATFGLELFIFELIIKFNIISSCCRLAHSPSVEFRRNILCIQVVVMFSSLFLSSLSSCFNRLQNVDF